MRFWGSGDDHLVGGAGDDTYTVDSGDDNRCRWRCRHLVMGGRMTEPSEPMTTAMEILI